MNTFILIMVLGGYNSQSGITVVNAEFSSREKCEAARLHIVKDVTSKKPQMAEIQSQGCFEK
jgi:hypothetical protein